MNGLPRYSRDECGCVWDRDTLSWFTTCPTHVAVTGELAARARIDQNINGAGSRASTPGESQ